MTNKWILGSTLSTLTGILAAALYLVLVQPLNEGSEVSNYNPEWLLWFFLTMVLVSMLVNLSVLIAPPAKWLSLISAFPYHQRNLKVQLNQYQEQVQQFFQRHQLQLQRLTSEADIYLWITLPQPAVVQIATDAKQPAGIKEMRLLFRWMLTHQCRRGYYISLQTLDLQAQIFAKEAGIEIVDAQALQKLQATVTEQKHS